MFLNKLQVIMSKYINNVLDKYLKVGTENANQFVFVLTIIFSVSLRFLHFGEIIDDPHGWRQCDTANYIWDYYKNGVDFLHPAVCWMGGYKTLILEFPLTEAIVAWLYQIFSPSVSIARLFFLFSYCLGVYYFYKSSTLFLSKKIAMFSTVIYTFLPLSYYYSRALHIDFFALSFAFGMFYYYSVGIQIKSVKKLVVGSLFATVAFLVKAPYALSFCFPLFFIITKEKKWFFCLKWMVLFIYPGIIFIWWIIKSNQINAMAPNWQFIPGYRKFDDNTKWYFGLFEHRFILRSWQTLFERFMTDMSAGFIGAGLFIIGILVAFKKKYAILWLWLFGVVLYLLLFFNLNVIHNYYQIPFVPILAIFMAIGIDFLANFFKLNSYYFSTQFFLLVTLIISSIVYAETTFFKHEVIYENIAKGIENNTKEDDLVIVSCGGLSVHCPIILHRAKRNGWSVPTANLNEKITTNLFKEGCNFVAFVDNEIPLNEFGDFLKLYPIKDIPIAKDKHLFLIDLSNKITYHK